MKIYRFSSETGIYLGENFADEALRAWGDSVVPADATTIAPPQVGCEEVPVFNRQEGRWEVRSR